MQKLNALAFGYAGATLAAIGMVVLGILGNIGIYTEAIGHMQDWHAFFSLSVVGIIGGAIEAAIWNFVIFWLFAWIYNLFVK